MKSKNKMLLIEYVGHVGLRGLNDGHLGRHLEYSKTLYDARVASVGFIKYNASTTRINKEKNFKIKFKVILVFYRTNKGPFLRPLPICMYKCIIMYLFFRETCFYSFSYYSYFLSLINFIELQFFSNILSLFYRSPGGTFLASFPTT